MRIRCPLDEIGKNFPEHADFVAEMRALADSSPDASEHRLDEPYRRALTGIYARLAATLKELTGGEAARHAIAPQNPYLRAEDFLVDLRTIEASLLAHHGSTLVQQRLHPLIRAVEVFGFHLATVDLRQNSEQHEEVVAELLAVAEHVEGQLTAAVHATADDRQLAARLMPVLERNVGRILFNGFGTGVEVSHAMVHGGPFPSTSDSRSTSVGAGAIDRFLRPDVGFAVHRGDQPAA